MNAHIRRPIALLTSSALALAVLGATDTSARGRAATVLTPAEKQAERYVERAVLKAVNGPDCAPGPYTATFTGPPPQAFRFILGVLRGGPSRRVPTAIARSIGRNQFGLYVNYIRLARVVGGLDYWVYVSDGSIGSLPPADVTRCLNAQSADLTAELPSIPSALRAAAEKLLAMQLNAERRIDREPVTEGVWLIGLDPSGAGGGGGGASAAEIERQGMFASESSKQGAILSGVLPDGVATVTFDYSSQSASRSHRQDPSPAASVTAPVVDNVVVTRVPRPADHAFGFKMIWRAANGRVIRIVPANQ